MSKILRFLILTDALVFFGFGLTGPIFAIFVAGIEGGSIAAAGIAQTIFMLVKSVLQLAVGRYTDRDPGYVREYWTSFTGYALIAIVPFLYLLVRNVPQLYAVQVLYGIAAAFAYPGWMVLFTKFVDRQKEGREWTFYSTVVFLGMALSASIGGWSVERYGFATTFLAMGIFALLGLLAFASLARYHEEFRGDHHPPVRHPRDVPPVK